MRSADMGPKTAYAFDRSDEPRKNPLHVGDDLGRDTLFHRVEAQWISNCAIKAADVLLGGKIDPEFNQNRAADALNNRAGRRDGDFRVI